MRHRKTCVFAAGVVAALIVSAGAGAKSDAGPQIDVSTAPAARDYLRSIGIDPSGFVVQRAMRNYAGPDCPGPSWNCTTATRVIQIATRGGRNSFDCEAPAAGTDHANNTCVSTQSSAHGNTSRCVIRSHAPTVHATCTITQTSAHGDNRAFIEMVADQSEGSRHKAVFKASVSQTSATGANRLHSTQKVEQEAKHHGGTVNQKQEGRFHLLVDQVSGSGKQNVEMHQSLDQDAKAVSHVLGGRQRQLGDLWGDIDQTSAGRSEISARQDEEQEASAPRGARVVQTQIGPSECCTRQLGNPGNKFDINQNARQEASQEGAFQSEIIKGSCISSGNCDVNQAARNNVDRERNSCTGHVCFIFIICRSGADGDDGEDDDDGERRFLAVRWHEGGCESGSGGEPS